MANKLERDFQRALKKRIKSMFPGCYVMKTDPNQIQGIPDLLILYKNKWAMLECKRSAKAREDPEPNQEYYVSTMDKMSFCRFIYPENMEEVLNDLQQAFES